MAQTKIEWTNATWNPVVGCSIVSSGCKNCYAMQMASRLEAMGIEKYRGLTQKRSNKITWNGLIHQDEISLKTPYKWRKPRKIFVDSMGDLFHHKVSDEFILKVWKVMKDTPQHNYQILTKRPNRMRKIMLEQIKQVLPNVWLGTSVESIKVINRIEHLRKTPAAIRFISFEPLIDSVGAVNLANIQWAIVGGESGNRARPMEEKWVDEIHAQCDAYGSAFFFKQWGAWGKDNQKRHKKLNGREYKGQTWDEMPHATGAVA